MTPTALKDLQNRLLLLVPDRLANAFGAERDSEPRVNLLKRRCREPRIMASAGHPLNGAAPLLESMNGSLDAVQLATGLIWRDRNGPLQEMATHYAALGSAARAFGFDGRGV